MQLRQYFLLLASDMIKPLRTSKLVSLIAMDMMQVLDQFRDRDKDGLALITRLGKPLHHFESSNIFLIPFSVVRVAVDVPLNVVPIPFVTVVELVSQRRLFLGRHEFAIV